MSLLIVLLSLNSAFAADQCIDGAYIVRNGELFVSHAATVGSTTSCTTSHPTNQALVKFLEANKSHPEINEAMQNAVGLSTDQAIDYLLKELAKKHATTKLYNDDPAPLATIAEALNKYYKYPVAGAKPVTPEEPKKPGKAEPKKAAGMNFDDLDKVALKNLHAMNKLNAACEDSVKADGPLEAVRVHFTDGNDGITVPIGLTHVDGSPSQVIVTFISGYGEESREFAESNGKTYYVAKDGRQYLIEISKDALKNVPLAKNKARIGSSSVPCYIATLSRQVPANDIPKQTADAAH